MTPASAGITALMLLAGPAAAQDFDQCRHEAQRDARVQASASERLVLLARAGSLRVEGRSGITEVRVSGRACASSPESPGAAAYRGLTQWQHGTCRGPRDRPRR
jgi:hypothetical protein